MADVEVSREDAVLTVTLNRPEVLNALNASVHAGLRAALAQAEDPAVRAVVITGAGRGFCVGQDLQEFRSGAGDVADNLRSNYHANVLAIRALEKPVVAAVNGPAAGAGMSLALACDVRIASDAASFVPAFIGIGLVPDSGGTWFARRLLGTARAFEWLTTGRRLGAEEARELGLVSEVVPAADFAERMREVGHYFASLPTRAVWQTKRLLDAAETSTLAEQLEREAAFSGAATPAHPISLLVHDDLRRWRLTVALRFLLALPHWAVVSLWGFVAVPVAVAAWVTTLVRGATPPGLHAWLGRYLRYSTHVNAYVYLVADPFPRFRGWFGTYPVDVAIAPPAPQPRWATLLRIVLAIPAGVLAYVLGSVAGVLALAGWFVAVALGRMPRGLRDLLAYILRYQAQTTGYVLLLTSRYPALAA